MKKTLQEEQIQKITDPSYLWDLLVIGGGATGLGIALEAASRGYKTLLVEQADFAKGTSSRSTKLVHGGVRYLAQGNMKLVREASVERGRLLRNAPHVVRNQTFIIPVYKQWEKWKYLAGLKLYDWISGRLTLGPSSFISKEETMAMLPGIKTNGLLGGVKYHDGQFDDARLAVNLFQTIIEQGGCALNYMKVTGLRKNEEGVICGAMIKDCETAISYPISAKAVVNATGVFVDDILQMDNAAAPKSICVSQGVHVVLDKKFLPSSHALMIPETSDGRVLFAVPWYNRVVIGTTDTPVPKASLEPIAMEQEIEFILETAAGYLTQPPQKSDVLSVFAGLRPLAMPTDGKQKTKEISRSHKIIVSPSNLFTILGGKWTTYRKMGEDTVDFIENKCSWTHRKSITKSLRIHGYTENVTQGSPFYFYGSDAAFLKQGMSANEKDWVSRSLQIHHTQIRWAINYETARTVEDMLSRRTRALLLDATESIRIAPDVARLMALELGRDEQWIEYQITSYTELARQYLIQEL